jgi:hypothetical protein
LPPHPQQTVTQQSTQNTLPNNKHFLNGNNSSAAHSFQQNQHQQQLSSQMMMNNQRGGSGAGVGSQSINSQSSNNQSQLLQNCTNLMQTQSSSTIWSHPGLQLDLIFFS